MKDAEVVEAMARAIQQTPSVWINTSQKGIDATYEVCVWTLHSPGDFEVLEAGFRTLYDAEKAIAVWGSRLRSRAAFEVCAPAIRERCAAVAEAEQATFLSTEYALAQPLSSIGERLACQTVAASIRAMTFGPTPHDGLTDTSHHAGSSAGQVIDPRFFVVDEGRQQLRAKRDATRAGSSAGESEDWRKELPGIARIAPAPSGGEMVMVPREPTPEMLIKAGRVLNLGGSFHEALRVAIAASPAPPHQGGKSE